MFLFAGTPKLYAKPALLIFDLHTDQLIKRYTFEPTDLKEDSFFANVVSVTNIDIIYCFRILWIFNRLQIRTIYG